MGFFGKTPKPRKFDYTPRYYDEGMDKLKDHLKKYGGDEKDNTEILKQKIKSGLRARGRNIDVEYRREIVKKSNLRLLTILVVLIFISYIFLTKYLPHFIEVFEK